MEGRQQELKDVFNLLESQENHVTEDIKKLIKDNLDNCRESWLIQSLVDYYYTTHSRSVVSIISELREPHDKHLLDKLHDGIKSPEHQLLALQLLLHGMCRQPSWMKLIITSSVLKVIIKCLKVETNIPVLMTAVTIVAILLPSVPTMISPYLPDLFEIFNRLAAFSVKKPAGNIPDVFLLHLEVAVYALFHRLYGMFPYNFLTYLRHHYMKKENLRVFEEVIQSMLERVRLHPNLFIGTKEQETSKDRWRQMETQDVVIECGKMSLDMIEGSWEQLHCPIVASRYYRRRPVLRHTPQFIEKNKDEAYSALPKPDIHSLNLENVYWSPSEVVGLSTPPASQRNTPGPSALEASTSSLSTAQHSIGPPVLTPLLTPPANTPRETPPISDDIDKARSHGPSKLQDPKRLSSEFSQYQPVPLLTPSSHIPSIPPSPLKPEFTSTPPFGIIRTQPVLNAARELQFDHSPADQSDTSPQEIKPDPQSFKHVVKPAQLDLSAKEIATGSPDSQPSTPSEQRTRPHSEVGELTDSLPRPSSADSEPRPDLSETRQRNRSGGSRSGTVCIDNLSKVVEGLESDVDGDDDDEVSFIFFTDGDDDDEVSELTSSSRSHTAYAMLTAESVAKFMKSVNRIRFNSLTSRNSVEKLTKLGSRTKSLSCPLLPKIDSMVEEEDELSRSASTTAFHKTSKALSILEHESVDGDQVPKASCDEVNLSVTSTSSTVTITTKQETVVATPMTDANLDISKCPMYSDPKTSTIETRQEDDFTKIFRLLLNPTSIAICRKCQSHIGQDNDGTKQAQVETNGPIFSRYSPPELLDRHLKLGSDIHTKELSQIPMPSTQNVNWTHFGGVPPADEISILRGQLLLLHNQLLYERHKREQHGRRNRRLLRRITHAKQVEEQNRVMSEQIQLNENTIRDMQVSLKLLLEENRKLKNAQESEEYEKIVHLRTCLQENEDLKAAKKEFNTLFVRQREEQDSLRKKLMASEAKLFNAEKELECMRQQAVLNSKLKEQVIQLHKELLLMGELQQKSQEKLQSQRIANSARHEHEYIQASLSAEIRVLKSKLETKSVHLEECCRQLKENLEQLNIKDIALTEAKRNIEKIKTSHEDEIKSVEEKHRTALNINQALEAHILQVYREIEEIKSKTKKQGLHRHPSVQSDTVARKDSSNNHSDDLHPEPRDRTNSDPLYQKRKSSLTRMTSEPLASSQPSGSSLFKEKDSRPVNGESRSQNQNRNNSRSQDAVLRDDKTVTKVPHEPGFSDALDIVESGDFVLTSIADAGPDTESLSSRSSVLHPSGASLLYTDSEDNRSISNRSSNLGDSGYMG